MVGKMNGLEARKRQYVQYEEPVHLMMRNTELDVGRMLRTMFHGMTWVVTNIHINPETERGVVSLTIGGKRLCIDFDRTMKVRDLLDLVMANVMLAGYQTSGKEAWWK